MKPSVGLVTDSSAGLPPEVAGRSGVRVVPVTIHLPAGDVHADTPTASRLVYETLERDEPVKSSAPSPLEYLAAIDECPTETVVVVVPAREFTVMHRNAALAADLADRPTAVIDCRTAAAAQGLVVLEAARSIADGAGHDEVVARIEDAARRAELVAMLDQLRFIRRSGRVSAAALGLAEELGIKPVFRLRHGLVERVAIPRSERTAIERIAGEARRMGFDADRAVVFHAHAPHRAERLRSLLAVEAPASGFSMGMGMHTGPGVAGVAWLRPVSRST